MSGQRETNPHFRPPPNQDQYSLLPTPAHGVATTPRHRDHQSQPQSEDKHSQPQPGRLFTQPLGQGQYSQPPARPWLRQPPIQGHHTQEPRPKKSKFQDQRPPPLGPWSLLPVDGPQGTEPISSRKQPQHPQPQQGTQPKHDDQHQQPHSPEAAIAPPLHRGDHQDQPRQSQGSLVPTPRQTNLPTWFLAGFCAIFWIVIILGGLIVLIVYLLFRPHNPRFDVSSVTLNAAYLDVGVLLNADLTVLANFTNPNKKVKVDFSYVVLDLYYGKTLIASQYVEPFSAARRTSWFTYVHMLTSQVRLPLAETERLKKEIDSNAVVFQVKGVFRARSNLGSFLRYSYWLYGHCTIVLTGPPGGVIRAVKCKTKR